MDKFYLLGPDQLRTLFLHGHLDQSCRCTFIYLLTRTGMCLGTRSRFRVSFGAILRLATGTRQELSTSMLISPRYAPASRVTLICIEIWPFPGCATQRLNVGRHLFGQGQCLTKPALLGIQSAPCTPCSPMYAINFLDPSPSDVNA